MKIPTVRMRATFRAIRALLSSTLLCTMLLAPWSNVQAANLAQGRVLIERNNCASCHGADFNHPISADYPKLAGQYADYLYYAMRAYQAGLSHLDGREHPVMKAQLQSLSESDLRDIAAYLESLPGQMRTKP